MPGLSDWITQTPLHQIMIETSWLFPAAETLHFMGLTLLFGGLLAIDLRGLGLIRAIPLIEVHKLVPVVIGAFSVNLATGIAFVFADPDAYLANPAFQFKLALIALAGINAIVFELLVFRPLAAGADVEGRVITKLTSGLSILIWTLVILTGRGIAFFNG